jgi:hypothetical protein
MVLYGKSYLNNFGFAILRNIPNLVTRFGIFKTNFRTARQSKLFLFPVFSSSLGQTVSVTRLSCLLQIFIELVAEKLHILTF